MITDNGLNIHISDDMLEQMRKRGHGTTGSEIKKTVCRWCGMLNAGEAELLREFTDEELDTIIGAVADQARADELQSRELWEMGADRLAAVVGMRHKELCERCLGLSELAAMYIKEKAGDAVAFRAGYGGRPKEK